MSDDDLYEPVRNKQCCLSMTIMTTFSNSYSTTVQCISLKLYKVILGLLKGF